MNALSDQTITIIGAGIGGLALACALRQRGATVTVLEQAREITEVGAGLQVSPNAFRVLRAIGVDQALADHAVRARAVRLLDYRGKQVAKLELSGLANQDYFAIHRADLIDGLAGRARELGVDIRLGQAVDRVEPGQPAKACLANGKTHEADLIVGADGLHSVVRRALIGGLQPFFTGQVAWRALVPNSGQRGPEVHLHMGPRRHIVSYPLRGGEMLNLVAVQERSQWREESWSQQGVPDNLRAAFADFGPEVQQMLGDVQKVYLWGLFRHPIPPNWYGAGTVLMGDAAHPTLPFLAQGAAMALEDAWVLADALDLPGSLDTRLAAYQTRRETRVRRVVDAASSNAWKYHLSFPPFRWGAHCLLRAVSTLAPDRLTGQYSWLYDHDVTS